MKRLSYIQDARCLKVKIIPSNTTKIVIKISQALPLEKWIRKSATVRRYARIAHHVYIPTRDICHNGQPFATLPTRQMKLFRNLPRRTNASAFCSLTSATLLLHAKISDLYNPQLQLF